MRMHQAYHCHSLIVVFTILFLASLTAFLLGVFQVGDVVFGEKFMFYHILLIVFMSVFAVLILLCIPSEVRYNRCLKKGHKGNGLILKLEKETSRGSGITRYLYVSFQNEKKESCVVKLTLEKEEMESILPEGEKDPEGKSVPLLIYKDYAIYEEKKKREKN